MTLRVLHVGKYFPPHRGGMENYLADLMAAQQRQGLSPQALVHRSENTVTDRTEAVEHAGQSLFVHRVAVWLVLFFAPLAPLFLLSALRRLRRGRPALLHLHLPNPSAFWLLLLPSARRLPWVVHWHADVVASKHSLALRVLYPLLYRPLEHALLKRATAIIATSPPYLESSAPLAPFRDKCHVIPLGLDPRRLGDGGFGRETSASLARRCTAGGAVDPRLRGDDVGSIVDGGAGIGNGGAVDPRLRGDDASSIVDGGAGVGNGGAVDPRLRGDDACSIVDGGAGIGNGGAGAGNGSAGVEDSGPGVVDGDAGAGNGSAGVGDDGAGAGNGGAVDPRVRGDDVGSIVDGGAGIGNGGAVDPRLRGDDACSIVDGGAGVGNGGAVDPRLRGDDACSIVDGGAGIGDGGAGIGIGGAGAGSGGVDVEGTTGMRPEQPPASLPRRRQSSNGETSSPPPLHVIAIGRLTYYKGLEHLIAAAGRCPTIRVTLLGDGEQAARLTAQIAAAQLSDRVRLLGAVDDATLAAYLREADLLCLSSIERTEAFGVVLLEAMAFGLPVLATRVRGAGMAWIIEESGAGRLVEPGDSAALAREIEALNGNRAILGELGARGRDAFAQRFHIDRGSALIADLYRQITAHS